MRSLLFLSCLSVLDKRPDVILSSQILCLAAEALPVQQLEKGSVALPASSARASPGAKGVRGEGLCVTP